MSLETAFVSKGRAQGHYGVSQAPPRPCALPNFRILSRSQHDRIRVIGECAGCAHLDDGPPSGRDFVGPDSGRGSDHRDRRPSHRLNHYFTPVDWFHRSSMCAKSPPAHGELRQLNHISGRSIPLLPDRWDRRGVPSSALSTLLRSGYGWEEVHCIDSGPYRQTPVAL